MKAKVECFLHPGRRRNFLSSGEAYWAVQGGTILSTKLENGRWMPPQSVVFSASITDYCDPCLSPSGEMFPAWTTSVR